MTDSTVANLNDISSNGGVQSGDMLYVLRSGTPDADFRADADDVLSFVENNATAFASSTHTHVLADIGDAGALAALNTVGTSQIDNDVVTYAKMQDVSATDKLLGRSTAGSGTIEEITCTAAARSLLDDVSASAMRTTLGLATIAATGAYADLSGTPSLGTLAAKSGVDLSTSDATGTLAASRFPALSGDVTNSTGSLSATIATNAVTNAKAAQMAAGTIKGNNTGSTTNAADLNATQVTAMLDTLVGDTGSGGTKGLVPAPSSGDAAAGKYLKADGTWAAPAGGDGSGDSADSTWFGDGSDGSVTLSSGTTTLTRDMYYSDLTISGSGKINNGGFRIFVSGTLDLTNAPAGALTAVVANNGGNASGTTAGAAGTAAVLTGKTVGGGAAGTVGSTGPSANSNATSNSGNQAIASMGGLGGGGGNGEKGGNGNGGALNGGSLTANAALPGVDVRYITPYPHVLLFTAYSTAQGGSGGAGGAGDASNTGTAGGGGGAGGNGTVVFAKTINRGASTTAGAISAAGGNGGNGTTSGGGNRGGGMGGCGGGGPLVYIVYKNLSGTSATSMIQSNGGNGGNGGNGTGTGVGGYGGAGGKGGVICLAQIGGSITVSTGTRTASPPALAGGANSGTTGGSGTTGETLSVSL